MIKLYSNENFAIPVVNELRKIGYDVLTIQETGKDQIALPDQKVLEYATKNNRAVVTFNRKDFIALHNESNTHKGIIVCSFDLDFTALAQRIHNHISNKTSLATQLIRINRS